jgi:hypothetical protein
VHIPESSSVVARLLYTQISIDCQPGTKETCNAIDDDCNGVIDDGCGYSSGAVQVAIGWDTDADIDMYVIDPSSSPLYYNEQHRESRDRCCLPAGNLTIPPFNPVGRGATGT